MSEASEEKNSRKAALKALKATRKDQIAAVTAKMKEQRQAVKAIKQQLTGGELTVPEIAEATGMPASKVLWYIATMKKYGEILEGPKDSSYFRYRLSATLAAEAGDKPEE